MTDPTDMPTKIEFPDHPVVIGVNIVTREGEKTVSCVEYREWQSLLKENEELAAVLELALSDGFYETATESYDCVPKEFTEQARTILEKRKKPTA